MTWNVDDLRYNPKSTAHPTDQQDDTQDTTDQQTSLEPSEFAVPEPPQSGPWVPNKAEREHMRHVGMVPDDEWAKLRRRMTRGIQPMW